MDAQSNCSGKWLCEYAERKGRNIEGEKRRQLSEMLVSYECFGSMCVMLCVWAMEKRKTMERARVSAMVAGQS